MPDPDEPRLTDAESAEVRRLLADARVDEPVPDDVVVRLDAALADLAAHRVSNRVSHRVVAEREADRQAEARQELAVRRARRSRVAKGVTWGAVAAAVVVLGGFGLSRIPDGGGSSASSSSDSGVAAGSSAPASSPAAQLPDIRSGHVRADLRRQADAISPAYVAGGSDGVSAACVVAGAGRVAVPATYDGRRAALVYGPVRGGERRVTLFRCIGSTEGERVAIVTVPAR